MDYNKITLKAQTRGYTKVQTFTKELLTGSERGVENSDWQAAITDEDANRINLALKDISTEQLRLPFEPADGVSNDSAYLYTLAIELQDKTIETDYFDLDNPPEVLKELIGALQQIISRTTND